MKEKEFLARYYKLEDIEIGKTLDYIEVPVNYGYYLTISTEALTKTLKMFRFDKYLIETLVSDFQNNFYKTTIKGE